MTTYSRDQVFEPSKIIEQEHLYFFIRSFKRRTGLFPTLLDFNLKFDNIYTGATLEFRLKQLSKLGLVKLNGNLIDWVYDNTPIRSVEYSGKIENGKYIEYEDQGASSFKTVAVEGKLSLYKQIISNIDRIKIISLEHIHDEMTCLIVNSNDKAEVLTLYNHQLKLLQGTIRLLGIVQEIRYDNTQTSPHLCD